MSTQPGKMIKCDRCGKTIFLKLLEEKDHDMDGGYTRWTTQTYEDKPANWKTVYFATSWSGNDLCPDCYEVYLETHAKFWWRDNDEETHPFLEKKFVLPDDKEKECQQS